MEQDAAKLKRCEDKLERCKERLLKDSPFFGIILCSTDIVITESSLIRTAGTDGFKMYWNLEFLDKLSQAEVNFVMLHEVEHIILKHTGNGRRKTRIPQVWNIATDYVVNLDIQECCKGLKQKHYKIPEGCLLDNKYKNMTSEQVYDKIKDQITITDGPVYIVNGDGGEDEGNGISVSEGKDDQTITGQFDEHIEKKLSDQEKKEINDRILGAAEAASKQRGTIPGGVARMIERLRKPKVDWARQFREYIGSKISFEGETWSQLSRRTACFYPTVILPAMNSTRKLDSIVVALDTSGSISQKEMDQFVSEIQKMSHLVDKIHIYTCDCSVYSYVEIGRFQDIVNSVKFGGFGGTDFRPVFDDIEKKRLRPKVLIYFTDTYGSFPEHQPKYPVVWVTQTEGANVPFGRLITMDAKDEEF